MNWIDIVGIVFVCVTVNHLGLIQAIEDVIGRRLQIVNCPKCLTFWVMLGYCCDQIATHSTGNVTEAVITVLAISFLASYAALWLELLESIVDNLYMKLYEKIITTNDNDTVAADAKRSFSAGTMP